MNAPPEVRKANSSGHTVCWPGTKSRLAKTSIMLREHQEKHIASTPKDKIARVQPFDPMTRVVAQNISERIKSAYPNAQVYYIGSSKLGIAGENDIDLTVQIGKEFDSALKTFETWYGKPFKIAAHDNYSHWTWIEVSFPVELHLIDEKKPYFLEQLKTQEMLESDADLRSRYERMKLESNGLPYAEYLKRKYEFWNQIIESSGLSFHY